MTENAKTTVFVAVGLLAVLVALVTGPRSAEVSEENLVGKMLTDKFSNAEDAKRLRIVRFDEDTATLREFEVAEKDGLWSIPSKEDYPADAQRQMAEAATSLMDRKILNVVSRNAGDHEEFGVIEPSPKLEVGAKGVGTRVTMSDVRNEPLVDLIIGKEVKGSKQQHYVREAGRDVVYVIEIDPAKLTTAFDDWIEKDLLKVNPWDLKQVQIRDYSAELVPVMTQQGLAIQVAWDPRSEMTLGYSEKDAKWDPIKLRKFESAKEDYVDFSLAEDQELNTESLNALKTALDDLKIVDVARKPHGLSDDLKAGQDFLGNTEARQDLRSKGFAAVPVKQGSPEEIISSDGELIATMNNGTEYVLRFGKLTDSEGSGQANDASKKNEPAEGDKKGTKSNDVHRYMFVMARFDEDAVKAPELEKLPELPAGAPKADEAAGGEAAAGGESATKSEAAATADAAATEKSEAKEGAEKSEAETKDAAAKTEDTAAAKDGDEKQQELETIISERKRIEEENQHKLDEYQETLKKGREAVKDLNLRFGDWYFVVDDEVFSKLRLGRENVIQKKGAKKDDAAAGNKKGAGGFGAPGTAIPGLPQIPGASR